MVRERAKNLFVCAMNVNFWLVVNKQNQTRFSRYYIDIPLADRVKFEVDLGRCCLKRRANEVSTAWFKSIV
jgi:uncharacterized Fe-S cluster-containing radical SAM superfamily protein